MGFLIVPMRESIAMQSIIQDQTDRMSYLHAGSGTNMASALRLIKS